MFAADHMTRGQEMIKASADVYASLASLRLLEAFIEVALVV